MSVDEKVFFATEAEMKAYKKEYTDRNYSKNLIMSQNMLRSLVNKTIIGNNNLLTVGNTTKQVMISNIKQMNSSYVIQDIDGELYRQLGKTLEDYGYKVSVLDLSDSKKPLAYNPLQYLDDEPAIMHFLDCHFEHISEYHSAGIMSNRLKKSFYMACILYIKEHSEEELSAKNVMEFIQNVQYDKDFEHMDLLFSELPENSAAKRHYDCFRLGIKKAAENVIYIYASEEDRKKNKFYHELVSSVFRMLSKLNFSSEINLRKVCEEKTAIFVITDSWNSYACNDFLASMLFCQTKELIMNKYEEKHIEQVEWTPLPVQFMIQDFSSIGFLPEFLNKISYFRLYNMSVLISIDDIRQLKGRYNEYEIQELFGSCMIAYYNDNQLQSNLRFLIKLLAKSWNTDDYEIAKEQILKLHADECVLLLYLCHPFIDKKIE